MKAQSQVYYFDIAQGLWAGQFGFRITDWKKFLNAGLNPLDRTLALLLDVLNRLPGRAQMLGEISGDPTEAEAGVARVNVAVKRFGLEIYRLSGYYALDPDGKSVWITIDERIGPRGSPLRILKSAEGHVGDEGFTNRYVIPMLGERWEGEYRLTEDRAELRAEYRSPWGSVVEHMRRQSPPLPTQDETRSCVDRLLEIACHLERIERRYLSIRDSRAVFAGVYAATTRAIAYEFSRSGYRDPHWVVALAEQFSRQFIDAAENHEKGCAPRAWERVFWVLQQEPLTPIDQLLLPMYVHIVHDLPRALVDVGLADSNGVSRVQDFHRVNEVLGNAIDAVQRRVASHSPLVAWLDVLGGRLDERLTQAGIGMARSLAWYDAERLRTPDARARAVVDIDRNVDEFLELMLGSVLPDQWSRRVTRRLARLVSRHPTPTNQPSLSEQARTVRGHSAYDPKTKIFTADISAAFFVAYETIKDVIDPERWDEHIPHIALAEYEAPLVGGEGLLREEVNAFHPFLDRPELFMRNLLAIRVEESPRQKCVRYRLEKSLDGSLDLDDGFISVERRGEQLSVIRFQKSIRVVNNPLLFLALRAYPAGLGKLLASWIGHTAENHSQVVLESQPSMSPMIRIGRPKTPRAA